MMRSAMRRVMGRRSTGVALALGFLVLCLAGCGGGNGFNPTTTVRQTPTPQVVSAIVVQPLVPLNTPGGRAIAMEAPGLVERLMAFLMPPVYAQPQVTVLTLPGFVCSAIGPQGSVVATATVDEHGNASFSSLPAGNYLFRTTSAQYPNTVALVLVAITASANQQTVVSDATATAVALIALSASNGNINGLDIAAFNGQAGTASFQAVTSSVNLALSSGASFVNTSTNTITDPTITAQVTTANSTLLTVVGRYPAPSQTSIPRTNVPIYVTFSQAMDTSTLPPTNTAWSVQHTSVSTGQVVTITNSNYSIYGSWSYSDSTRTVFGVSVPAHSLVFSFTQTMAAGSAENFLWQFSSLPRSANGTVLTASASVSPAWNYLTFYTGN